MRVHHANLSAAAFKCAFREPLVGRAVTGHRRDVFCGHTTANTPRRAKTTTP
jgi:hypothetical protein